MRCSLGVEEEDAGGAGAVSVIDAAEAAAGAAANLAASLVVDAEPAAASLVAVMLASVDDWPERSMISIGFRGLRTCGGVICICMCA